MAIYGNDFLNEQTRRERRALNLVAMGSLIVVIFDLVPTRISTLGIDFGAHNQRDLIWLLLIFTVVLLALFVVYALADLTRWRDLHARLNKELGDQEENRFLRMQLVQEGVERYVVAGTEEDRLEAGQWITGQALEFARNTIRIRTGRALLAFGWFRALIDFVAPILLGVSAIVVLLVKLA